MTSNKFRTACGTSGAVTHRVGIDPNSTSTSILPSRAAACAVLDAGLIQDRTQVLNYQQAHIGLYALNTLHADLHKPAQITCHSCNYASSGLKLPRRISNQRLAAGHRESI